MKYFLFALFVSVNLGLTQNRVWPSYEGETVTFEGEAPVRYIVDNDKQTITLPDAVLGSFGIFFPHDFKVTQKSDHLFIQVGGPFYVTISADEHTLTVVRNQVLGSTPEPLVEDERAPVVYKLSNAEPAQVASLLKSMYSNIKVEIDTRQRALLVIVNPQDKELIDQVITKLDAQMPQVIFEAEIIEVNQNIAQSLGINYTSLFSFNFAEQLQQGQGVLSLGSFNRGVPLSLNVGINLLKTSGAAEVLARPRVTTLDGVQAQLNATQTFPVVVSSSETQQSVQSITTGVKLSLTPKISPDGMIEADISISVSTPTGITSQNVPTFSSRDATTTVRVANGEPIIIGGLYEKRRLEGKQKVPILGDIPLLGALFTSTTIEERETDLVILVIPRIVESGDLSTVATEPQP